MPNDDADTDTDGDEEFHVDGELFSFPSWPRSTFLRPYGGPCKYVLTRACCAVLCAPGAAMVLLKDNGGECRCRPGTGCTVMVAIGAPGFRLSFVDVMAHLFIGVD